MNTRNTLHQGELRRYRRGNDESRSRKFVLWSLPFRRYGMSLKFAWFINRRI